MRASGSDPLGPTWNRLRLEYRDATPTGIRGTTPISEPELLGLLSCRRSEWYVPELDLLLADEASEHVLHERVRLLKAVPLYEQSRDAPP